MKIILSCFVIFIFFSLQVSSAQTIGNKGESKWILVETKYVQSFEENCDIFVNNVNHSNQNILLVQPSIEYIFNTNFGDIKYGDFIFLLFIFELNDTIKINNIIIKKNNIEIEDSVLKNNVINILQDSLKSTELLDKSNSNSLSFGIVLNRKI